MENRLFQDVPPDKREQYLKDNALRVVPIYTYTRELEQGEISDRQDQLSQILIKKDQQDQILKEAREAYNAIVKPLNVQLSQTLQEVRTRSEEVTGSVYVIENDNEKGYCGVYTPEGVKVVERALLPEERQYDITEQLRKVK